MTTDTILRTGRRATDAIVNAWHDCSSPWRDDHKKAFSLTKILATIGMLLACYSVGTSHAITLNHLWLVLASYACAFGKSTFNFLLTKMQYSASRAEAETHVVVDETKRLITEVAARRDPVTGIEAAQ